MNQSQSKCNNCGASFAWPENSNKKRCEYCGTLISRNSLSLSFPTFKNSDQINAVFKSTLSQLLHTSLPSRKKILSITTLIVIPGIILTSFLVHKKRQDSWINLNLSSDKVSDYYVKKGKWSENKIYRYYQSKLIFINDPEPYIHNSIVNCNKWQDRSAKAKTWNSIGPNTNGYTIASIMCNKPKFGRELRLTKPEGAKSATVRRGFWFDDKRFRVYKFKVIENSGEKVEFKIYADCLRWKFLSSKKKGWNDADKTPDSKGYELLSKVCERKHPFINTDLAELSEIDSQWNKLSTNDNGETFYTIPGEWFNRKYRYYLGKIDQDYENITYMIADCENWRWSWLTDDDYEWKKIKPDTYGDTNFRRNVCKK